jgi:hypothetical protein
MSQRATTLGCTDNTALSLIAERAQAEDSAMIEERIYLGRLAHATLMLEEIDRLVAEAHSATHRWRRGSCRS